MTEEEAKQAIVEAALAWDDAEGDAVGRATFSAADIAEAALEKAVAAYREATKPEPFEAYVGQHEGRRLGPTAYSDLSIFDGSGFPAVWRCTVTPIERVR